MISNERIPLSVKTLLITLVLLSVVLLSGCGSEKPKTVTQESNESPSNQVTTQPEQKTDENMTWSSENNEVKLTPVKKTSNYGYQGVTVEVGDIKKAFNWSFTTFNDHTPLVFYTDVTGDGKKEAVIILHKGTGMGINFNELHVLNSEDFSEIKVQDFEEILDDQIESQVTRNDDGTLAITVKTQGKEYKFSHDDLDPDRKLENKLCYGNRVSYWEENQKIVAIIAASIAFLQDYVCDFQIIYKFDNTKNEFIVDQIKIEPY